MATASMVMIGLALVFGLYMAWSIGANDVANAMGTSVGSGALTLKRAVILAAIMEFCGAFFIGPNVSETIRKGIFDPQIFADAPQILVLGMLAALLAAAVWLQLASYFGWPVSTTHSIVGAIVGFGVAQAGWGAINWGKVSTIVASWFVSPLLAASISFCVFWFVLWQIFHKPDPVKSAKRMTPYMVFVVMMVMMLVLSLKGLKPFWKDHFDLKPTDPVPVIVGLSMALVAGIVGYAVSRRLVQRVSGDDEVRSMQLKDQYTARAMNKAIMHLQRAESTADGETQQQAIAMLAQAERLRDEVASRIGPGSEQSAFGSVERIFIYLQVISACFVALAHGANDVANAIGPLSVAVETAKAMKIPDTASVPLWALGLGAVGIVIGLATWGWRVMQTIGRRITELTPSRGFCAEFAAALTILLASVWKLPISTTHTLVGAVLGVGLARGIRALNLNTVRDIGISWVVTIPVGAGLTVVFFYLLRAIFSPWLP